MSTSRIAHRGPVALLCIALLGVAGCTDPGPTRLADPPAETGPDARAGDPGVVDRPIDGVDVDPPNLDVTYRYGIPGCEEPAGVRIAYERDVVRVTALSRRVAEPDAECEGDVATHTERIALEEPLRARDIVDGANGRVLDERP